MSRGKFAARQLDYKKAALLREVAVIILFFAGLALIAAGLWYIWPPVALIFGGVALIYLAGCVNMTAKSSERTVKK